MDQYDDSAKRLCYRCDKCSASFADYKTLRAHLEANCLKTFDQPSTTVFAQAISNPPSSRIFQHLIHSLPDLKSQQATTSLQHSSQFSSEVEMNGAKADKLLPDFISRTGPSQSLMDTLKSEAQSGHISPQIYLSIQNLKAASARRQSTLVACEALCAKVQRVAVQYNEAIYQKNLALKAYNSATSRHKELSTINSEQEQVIMNNMLSKSLARLKSAYKDQGILAKSLQQAVSIQVMSYKAASVDLDNEQTALNEAIKTYNEVKSSTTVTQAVFEELTNAQNQLHLNINYLINLDETTRKQQGTLYRFLMTSLTVPTSPDITMNKSRRKRPCFRCEDCDANFKKFKRLEIHRKSHCMKRLKNSPSSTICADASMNTNLPSSGACRDDVTSQVTHPVFEKLHLAMAVKRSSLEASLKIAVDAQHIINLHKVAQQQTQKAFEELDQILNWERALRDSASPEEQRRVSAARVKALIRYQEAYKIQQHSRMAVKQVLSRQKDSIEAAVMATSHEQAALIAAFRGLKVPAEESQMQHANAPVETSVTPNKEAVMETPKQKAEEIFAGAISKSSPEKRLLYTPKSPKYFVGQKIADRHWAGILPLNKIVLAEASEQKRCLNYITVVA